MTYAIFKGKAMVYQISVLIVEDDMEVARNLQNYLKKRCLVVDTCYNGREAFEKYLSFNYDMIISDIEMPLENGISLFKKIRSLDHEISLVLFSGHTHEAYLMDSITLKLDGYIKKPITSKKLDELFQKILSSKRPSSYTLCHKHNISYSYTSKTITHNDHIISLTHFEISVIELFIGNKDHLVTHESIAESLYDYDSQDTHNKIKNIIKRLRHKMPFLEIKSLPKIGYKLLCKDNEYA